MTVARKATSVTAVSPKVHEFLEELKKSENSEVYSLIMPAIQFWWPGVNWEVITDRLRQKLGVDMLLQDAPSLQYKTRWKTYDDFLIEYEHEHDDGHLRPGWIEEYQPENVDWIIYVQVPARKVTRVEVLSLKAAWAIYRPAWRLNGPIPSRNPSYWTNNCAVSWAELERAHVLCDAIEIPRPSRLP